MWASSRSRRWSSRETRAGFGERKRRPHRHRRRARARRAVPRRRRGGRAQARATDLSRAPRGGARADAGRAQSARGGGSAGGGQTGAGPEGQVAEEHGLPGAAAPGGGQREARGRAAHHAQRGAAPRREAIDRHGRRHGEHGRGGVSLPPVLAEHRGAGAASLAAPAPKHSSRGGGLVPGTSRRVGERSHAPQAVGELCVRPRSAGSDRAGRTNQGVPGAARRLDCGRALRALLFQREAAVRRLLLGLAVLSAGPTVRPSDAQDTSAIDRGVRIGIVYRPGVRPELRARLPALKDPGLRLAIHQLADRVLEAALGVGGTAATRVLFVMDGKVYSIDQDGADQKLVSSSDHQAMSPAWAADGRRFSYMEFWQGHGRLFLQEVASGMCAPVATTGQALDFTPAFSPDGKTLAFSRATEEGTDLYTVNIKDGCCLQRLTVGRFYDNLSPTYSPDGQRIAFVSTRAGLPQIYAMAADGTDQQLFAPFDYGATGSSNAPEWSPDGQTVAFHRDVGGTLQVFVLDVRTRAVRQLTSVGRNEDPTWAPDSRHMAFVSDRSGYRQLWIIDVETGRIRPLLQQSGARLPAWSPRLPETASSTP